MRVSFEVVNPEAVSLISKQSGGTFTPYMAHTGKTFDVLRVVTITVAWIVYRPQLGVALLIVAGGLSGGAIRKRHILSREWINP